MQFYWAILLELEVSPKNDSLLSDLISMIPGYGAYREQEQRRTDDRAARDFLSVRLNECKARLDAIGTEAVANGDLETPVQVEKTRASLELARNRITSAVEGYSGWFSDRKVDAELLDRIIETDHGMVSVVDQIYAAVAPDPNSKYQHSSVAELLARLQSGIDSRDEILSNRK